MIYILSWKTKKHHKNTFKAPVFKDEVNSRTFQGLPLKFKDFQDCANPVYLCFFFNVEKKINVPTFG